MNELPPSSLASSAVTVITGTCICGCSLKRAVIGCWPCYCRPLGNVSCYQFRGWCCGGGWLPRDGVKFSFHGYYIFENLAENESTNFFHFFLFVDVYCRFPMKLHLLCIFRIWNETIIVSTDDFFDWRPEKKLCFFSSETAMPSLVSSALAILNFRDVAIWSIFVGFFDSNFWTHLMITGKELCLLIFYF